MPELDLDAQIDEILDRSDWWQLPESMIPELENLLAQMYVDGLNLEAGKIEALQRGLDKPPFTALAWDIKDQRVLSLIEQHAAEMVTNVNEGTKFYLRRLIKEGVEEGLGTTQIVESIQKDLFGLPAEEASKFSRNRLLSIVNFETSKAQGQAGALLRKELGLKSKQWFTSNVTPCKICLGNQAQEVVPADFLYDSVFGPTLTQPGHPNTCRCLVTAVESEVRALGTEPIDWPMVTT